MRGQQFHDPQRQLRQVKIRLLKVQLARFELGEVQQVIKDHQQTFSRVLRRGGIGFLLGVEVGVHEHRRHAHDGIHRRADFVAHHGEEV